MSDARVTTKKKPIKIDVNKPNKQAGVDVERTPIPTQELEQANVEKSPDGTLVMKRYTKGMMEPLLKERQFPER